MTPRYLAVKTAVIVASVTGSAKANASRRGDGRPGFSISSWRNLSGAEAETANDSDRSAFGCFRQNRIEDWTPCERVDGIWANASLLHLGMEAIAAFFGRLSSLLAPGGAAFFSFKSGVSTGMDGSGRFFTNFTGADLRRVLDGHPELVLLERWESRDKLERAGFVWLSFILGLKPGA